MELRLTRNSVLDTVLRDAQGKPLYRIESPFKVVDRRTILSRILPNPSRSSPHDDEDRTGRAEDDVRPDNASDTDILLAGMEERVVGEILWQDWKQSVFKFDGKERKLKDYFPGEGLLARNRSFVAMDGKQYKWTVGLLGCWMKRNDKSSEILVKYHMRSFGILGKARNPYLEISEDVQPILDEVLLTFIWLERRREQADQRLRQSGG